MARIALAVDPDLEASLAEQAVRHGHEVVARATSAWELERGIPSLRPEAAIAGAGPRTLTPELLAACDEHGVRLVVLAEDESDRRRAAAIGLLETVDASAPWEELEPRILGAGPTPTVEAPRERGITIAVWGPCWCARAHHDGRGDRRRTRGAGLTVALADVDTHARRDRAGARPARRGARLRGRVPPRRARQPRSRRARADRRAVALATPARSGCSPASVARAAGPSCRRSAWPRHPAVPRLGRLHGARCRRRASRATRRSRATCSRPGATPRRSPPCASADHVVAVGCRRPGRDVPLPACLCRAGRDRVDALGRRSS